MVGYLVVASVYNFHILVPMSSFPCPQQMSQQFVTVSWWDDPNLYSKSRK